jgi:hypothetical protein
VRALADADELRAAVSAGTARLSLGLAHARVRNAIADRAVATAPEGARLAELTDLDAGAALAGVGTFEC